MRREDLQRVCRRDRRAQAIQKKLAHGRESIALDSAFRQLQARPRQNFLPDRALALFRLWNRQRMGRANEGNFRVVDDFVRIVLKDEAVLLVLLGHPLNHRRICPVARIERG